MPPPLTPPDLPQSAQDAAASSIRTGKTPPPRSVVRDLQQTTTGSPPSPPPLRRQGKRPGGGQGQRQIYIAAAFAFAAALGGVATYEWRQAANLDKQRIEAEARAQEQQRIALGQADKQQMAGLNAQIASLRSDIETRDATIAGLRNELQNERTTSEKQTRTLSDKLDQESSRRAALEKSAADLGDQLTNTKALLDQERTKRIATEQALADSRATVPTPRPATPTAPTQTTAGTLIWRGQVQNNMIVSITGDQVDEGAISGLVLPGVPVQITYPQDLAKRLTFLQMPNAQNGYRGLRFRITGVTGRNASLTIPFRWTRVGGTSK